MLRNVTTVIVVDLFRKQTNFFALMPWCNTQDRHRCRHQIATFCKQDLPLNSDKSFKRSWWARSGAAAKNAAAWKASASTGKGIPNNITGLKPAASTKTATRSTLGWLLGELSTPAIIMVDHDCNCIFTNRGWNELTGTPKPTLRTRDWLQAIHPAERDTARSMFSTAIATGNPVQFEMRLQRNRGCQPWVRVDARNMYDESNKYLGCVGTFTDITEHKKTSDSLLQLSLYDALTGLPNRTLMMRRLNNVLKRERDPHKQYSLIYVDLDGFKLVNDTLGHAIGNDLIVEVSNRISNCLENQDTLARLGSDEFTVLIDSTDNPKRATQVAQAIMASVKQPFSIDEETVYITASIGISVTADDTTPDMLMRQADVAMDNAKQRNTGSAQYYNPVLAANNRAKLTVAGYLHGALERNEFQVYYQPQLDIRSNTIVGSEALLRWRHQRLGSISPAIFVPLLESKGLIVQTGEWVLRQACTMQASWLRQYPGVNTTVSVNVSSIQLHDQSFPQKLQRVLHETGLSPKNLVLELTETILLDDYVSDHRVLEDISALGVKIALDDFGTGYSSFSYLKSYPIDYVKIDRLFIDNLFNCEENKAITTSIIDLAHRLGKTVVAEGVDSQEELDFLMMKGCDTYQGFLSSRAIPSHDFAAKYLKTASAALSRA